MFDFGAIVDGTYLFLNTDQWFFGSDGKQYNTVWGKVKILKAKDVLGFEPRNAVNYLLQVGEGDNALFLMGCRVHYAQLCLKKPVHAACLIVE